MAKKIKFSSAPNKKKKINYDDLLEDFSPIKVGKIFPTNADKPPVTLESFRPKKNTCLDYNLSETYLRWQVGDTKIRASRIRADYVPAPPGYFSDKPKYGSTYFSGRPPVWKFLDEIEKEKIEKRQLKNKAKFAEYLKKSNAGDRYMHRLITSWAGPVWFQELSPTQKRTVDRLQECILKDLKRKTIQNVKENMVELGIYFPPKNKALKMALDYCCGNDVEFLLILYQVSNPKRTNYSINDRLLLSAVVHLTIEETLRECHIRMPSPPRKESSACKSLQCKGVKHPKKNYCATSRPRKVEYESPYLIPYTFKPDPPKFSGKYENTYVQYPKSEYFSYLDELREEMRNSESVIQIDISEINDPIEQEFIKEMQEAEKMYNKLPHKSWKCLLRPSIKIRCMDFINRPGAIRKVDLPPLCAVEILPRCTCLDKESTDSECCTDFFKCECNRDTRNKCICKEYAKNYLKYSCKRCQFLQKESSNNIVGGMVEYEGNAVPIIQGIFKEKECDCLQRFKTQLEAVSTGNKMSCNAEKFTIGGVAFTKSGPAYIINSKFTNQNIADQIVDQKEESAKKDVCTCNLPKGGLSEKCFMDDFVKKDEDEEVEEKQSIIMPWETAKCTCSKGLKDFMDEQCTCPDCLENTRPRNATYVVSGVSSIMNNEGELENIINISGVRQERCNCLHNFKDKIKKLEEYRQRTKARLQMKTRENKYSIGGVAMGQSGPVYNIQGVTQPITCTCLEDHNKAEEEAKKRMPQIPNMGRIKYGISGVAVKEEKNFYNISHTLPIKPCSCEKLFDNYESEHTDCIKSYQDYLKTTEEQIKSQQEEIYESDESMDASKGTDPEEILDDTGYEENIEEEEDHHDIPNYTACFCAPPRLGNQEISPCQKKNENMYETKIGCKVELNYRSPKKHQNRVQENVDSSRCQSTALKSMCCSCQQSEEATFAMYDQQENQNGCRCQESDATGKCECQKNKENEKRSSCQNEIEEVIVDHHYEDIDCDKDNEEENDFNLTESGAEEEEEEAYENCEMDEEIQYDTNEEFQDTDYKRFFIMKKIPCKKKDQIEILKKLLKSLELDGYPLAKLPQCYKLPIFQLWMYLRCGKSWKQHERRRLNGVSKKCLTHTSRCYPKISIPRLNISPKLLDKLNWNHFEFIRNMTTKLEFNFRRQIKYERINSAREYFPILFDYWFPFWTFRDCYFAYMPAKENDIYVGNFKRNQTSIIKYRDMSCFTYNKQ
ncbi:uncharacterized protein LOC130442443 [Diorhabda sublineata]|uniref:uncharacterized protein LOC130442443 n=1 Tax=Diorhabda sublineata TaxID=1163346 RepID=UPI0024E16282|nr:uncharacterized protein LOC130442443 [Diorhabda sublineata]